MCTQVDNNNNLPELSDRERTPEKGLAHNVVISLSSDLAKKGDHMYTDNFYTSPALFSELIANGFEACGIVRCDRKGIPKDFQKILYPKLRER